MKIQVITPHLPEGWDLVGNGGVSSAVPGIPLPENNSAFAWIDTQSTTRPLTPAAQMADFGSTLLSAPFTVPAGQTLSLDLNFLSNNGDRFNDYAYVQLLSYFGVVQRTLYLAVAGKGDVPTVPPVSPPHAGLAISNGVILSNANGGVSAASPVNFKGDIVTLAGATYGPNRSPTIRPDGPPEQAKGGSTGWVTASCPIDAGSYRLFMVIISFFSTPVPSAVAMCNIRLSDAP